MYGEATRDRGLQARLQVETKELVTETMRGRVSVKHPARAAKKQKNFCGSAPNPAETQPPSGAGPRTPSGHQYCVQISHMLTQPRKTVLRTRRRLAPPARERLMPSHSKHDNITVLLSVHSPKSPVLLPTTLPQNYRSLRRIRDDSNHWAPAGAGDNPTNDVCYFKK